MEEAHAYFMGWLSVGDMGVSRTQGPEGRSSLIIPPTSLNMPTGLFPPQPVIIPSEVPEPLTKSFHSYSIEIPNIITFSAFKKMLYSPLFSARLSLLQL